MASNTLITVAHGDGIGPEIIEIGEKVYLSRNSAGIEPSSRASQRRTKVFLKAPITIPQGGGFKSLNVTNRGVKVWPDGSPEPSTSPVLAWKSQ
jgi:isocitrate dehydrogenase